MLGAGCFGPTVPVSPVGSLYIVFTIPILPFHQVTTGTTGTSAEFTRFRVRPLVGPQWDHQAGPHKSRKPCGLYATHLQADTSTHALFHRVLYIFSNQANIVCGRPGS